MARQVRAKGGAEQSVSPVGCSPKAKAMRKRGEQGSAGHGSDLRDHCEPDRANEVSSSHGGDASPRP